MKNVSINRKIAIAAGQNKKERDYWINKLSGTTEKSSFPFDYEISNLEKLTSDTETFQFENNITNQLMKLSRDSFHATHIVLMAALSGLLSKYSGNRDIIIGTPVYYEENTQEEDFLNSMLPLRVKINNEISFKQLLIQTKQNFLEAIEYQAYPIELIPQIIDFPDQSQDHGFPLFDVILILENIQNKKYIRGLQTNITLSLNIENNEASSVKSITGKIEYNSLKYSKKTILRIIRHFSRLLEVASNSPDTLLSDIDILSKEEKEQLLVTFNDSSVPIEDKTLHQLFEKQSELTPHNVALTQIINSDTKESITYLELNSQSNQIAYHLIKMGLKSDTLVALQVDRSIRMMVTILGILKAGGAYLPIAKDYPKERVNHIILDSATQYLIGEGSTLNNFDTTETIIDMNDLFQDCINTNGEKNETLDNPKLDLNSTNLAYVIYTSGSTGKPKGTLIRHKSVVNLLTAINKKYPLEKTDSYLLKTPYVFDVSVSELFGWFMGGTGSHLTILAENEHKDPRKLIEAIINFEISHINFVPSLFKLFLETLEIESPGLNRFTTLKYIFLAGEELHPELVKRARKIGLTNNIKLENLYGPTEATVYVTGYPLESWSSQEKIPIGKPLGNVNLYILDKNEDLQAIGIAGELYIGGISLARGYLNKPELTAKMFYLNSFNPPVNNEKLETPDSDKSNKRKISKFYHTGDLTRWKSDGNIEYLGRIDHQIKIRGFRIELGEIENQLLKYEGIKEAIVIDSKTDNSDKFLCAYIVPQNKDKEDEAKLDTINSENVKTYLSEYLPEYMIPMFFATIDTIPLTINGKIDREALPKPNFENKGKKDSEFKAPENQIQEKLVEIWSKTLRLKTPISINANFFEIGGHSITGIASILEIQKSFNVKLSLEEFFKVPTIKLLSSYIEQKAILKETYALLPAVEEKEYYPLSSPQKRLFILNQMESESTSYNLYLIYQLAKKPEIEKLTQAFQKTINRHHSFRTIFSIVKDEPVQFIQPKVKFELERLQIVTNQTNSPKDTPTPSTISTFIKEILKEFVRPFDLSQAPLLRAKLVETSDDKSILLIDMHHIISDGTSLEIFKAELLNEYESVELPELRIQYKDYAQWMNTKSQIKHLETQKKFWLKKLAGEIPVLNLPLDFKRPIIQSVEGSGIHFQINANQTQALKRIAKEHNSTPFMILISVFNILLSKLSNQEDIIIGTPTAGRTHPEINQIIGMFINTLTLRNYPNGEKKFLDFLMEVKQDTLNSFENQEYPFEELVEQTTLNINRDTSRNPIFDVMFAMQNFETYKHQNTKLNLSPINYETNIAKFDLTLFAAEGNEILGFYIDYCTKLFKESTIHTFISIFKEIIDRVTKNPEAKISEIEIIQDDQKKRIIEEFNNTSVEYPREKTLQELFINRVKQSPDHIAVVETQENSQSDSDKSDENLNFLNSYSISFKELDAKSSIIAETLTENNVKADTLVGIMATRSIEMIIGVLAIIKAGGAYLPLNPDYPKERINYMLADSKTSIILTSRVKLKFDNGIQTHINLDQPIKNQAIKTVMSNWDLKPSNLSYIIYTSGTTGKPKAVMVKHINIIRLVSNSNFYTFYENSRILQTGALEFDASTFEIWGSILNGIQLHLVNNEFILSAEKFKYILHRNRITTIWLTAPLFNQLLEQDIQIFKKLTHLLVGGDILSPSHINRLKKEYPLINIINGYGPTENTTFSTTFLIEKEYPINIPIGRPISNSTAYIVDRNNLLLPIGIPGELLVGGDGIARGYLNNPELTYDKFVSQRSLNFYNHSFPPHSTIYRTSDLSRWKVDGTIEFLGRIDQQVKIRGFRIELEEIENQLLNHSGIKEGVVIAFSDDRGDKQLCAYIVCERKIEVSQVREFLAQRIPDYMVPSYFIKLEKIPLNQNGKVDKKALPSPEKAVVEKKYTAARSEIERTLVTIWAEVLGRDTQHIVQLLESIGIDDNFFELGGHSLKGTIIISKIHRQFNTRLSLAQLFQHPTIRKLSEYINKHEREKYISITPVEEKEYYPVSSAQKRQYILNQIEFESTVYNIPTVFQLKGEIDINKLRNTFQQLIIRHESFRTSFLTVKEEPVQRIHKTVEFEIENIPMSPKINGINKNQISLFPEHILKSFVRPFDLTRAPLLRVGLIEPANESTFLLVDLHHIISDGFSQEIFKSELAALYHSENLTKLYIQYKDFSQWQNSKDQKEIQKKQKRYWLKSFSDEIPVLTLPLDFKRPNIQSFEGNCIYFNIGMPETNALKQLIGKYNVTLFMVLSSIFNILLSKLSNQEDIVIGTPVAGRRHPDLENIIGMFVNTVPLRNFPHQNKRFNDFLNDLNNRTLDSFENQDYPFEEFVEQLVINRDTGRNPIFDVMFALQNLKIHSDESWLMRAPTKSENLISKFDLSLHSIETKNGISLVFEYCIKLYREESINRFITYFKNIITAITNNPEVKLCDIEILSSQEKKKLLYSLNETVVKSSTTQENLLDLFIDQADRKPDNVALLSYYPKSHLKKQNRKDYSIEQNISISYKELYNQALHLANRLSKKGIGPEIITAIMMERSIEMIVGIFAILLNGGVYLPIDPNYPQDRIHYILKDSNTQLLLTHPSSSLDIHITNESIIPVHNSTINTALSTRNNSSRSNLAYVIYTSGSTGNPKGVLISHKSAINIILNLQRKYPLLEKDSFLFKTSFVFDVSVAEIFGWYSSGGKLSILSPGAEKDPEMILNVIQTTNITHLNFVPSMFNVFVDILSTNNIEIINSLKYILLAGEALSPTVIKKFSNLKTNVQLENIYGPTEATIYASSFSIKEYKDLESIPIGKPLDNVRLFILNKEGRIQPENVSGELCISGSGLARGYLNRPELTAEKFNPFDMYIDLRNYTKELSSPESKHQSRLYRTGDIARWTSDGNIEFLGRIDHQIKIRGFRIELGEIETILSNHPSIKDAIVIPWNDKNNPGEKYLCAYIVLKDKGTYKFDYSEITAYLSNLLPHYMIPTYFTEMNKLPLTTSGKLNRNELPEPRAIKTTEYIPPRNTIEKQLLEIWINLLDKKDLHQLGIDDNFFQLGGHSLKATVLTARMYKKFGVRIPLGDIFKTPTIRGLAEYIKASSPSSYFSIEPVEKKDYYPLSSAQKRQFILSKMDMLSTVYNVPAVFILTQEPEIDVLENAVKIFINRHESFRTAFITLADKPVQIIQDKVEFKIEQIISSNENIDESNENLSEKASIQEQLIKNFIRPFDISNPPLIRVGLIKYSTSVYNSKYEYILILDMPHIITDGISLNMILNEIKLTYNNIKLKPINIQYKDYSQWESKKSYQTKLKKQQLYWLNIFKGELPVLELPLDYKRPTVQRFDGNGIHFSIEKDETQALYKLADTYAVTPFMILITFFNILLAKISGQEDIVVGTPVAGRNHPDITETIGMFVKTLALRSYPKPRKKFIDFLTEQKNNTLNAFENQDFPFEELIEKIKVIRDTSRNPLFDVMFVLQNLGDSNEITQKEKTHSGLETKPFSFTMKSSKFDMTLFAMETSLDISFYIEFCTKIFKEKTIQRFIQYYKRLISNVLKKPELKISEIEIISENNKREILYNFNNTKKNYPNEDTIHKLFVDQVKQAPHHIATVGICNPPQSENSKNSSHTQHKRMSISYNELNIRADRLAHHLKTMGAGIDSIIALKIERSIELIIAVLGIIKAGSAYLPIGYEYPEDRISYMLKDSRSKILLVGKKEDIKERPIKSEVIQSLYEEHIQLDSETNCDQEIKSPSNSLAYIIYTSGTTGKPKAVMISHKNVIRLVSNTDYVQFNVRERILQTGALEFDASTFEIWGSLLNGMQLNLVGNEIILAPDKLKLAIKKNRISIMWLTAPLFNQLLEQDIQIFENLSTLLVGGDALSPSHINRLRNRYPDLKIINGYGPTENTTFSTTYTIKKEHMQNIPIGRPITHSTAYIIDKNNQLQPVGIPGELIVGGDGLSRGYLNKPELTADKFVYLKFSLKEAINVLSSKSYNTPKSYSYIYRTGDLARWLDEGIIEFIGRIDHQVKIRGFRIELEEIENQLLNIPIIQDTVVIVRTANNGDKFLCAYIVCNTPPDTNELRNCLTQKIPDYMIPSYFIPLEKLPLNSNGKIDTNALPAPEIKTNKNYTGPRNTTEKKLIQIYSEILNLQTNSSSSTTSNIGIDDNFFDMGGHSLKATMLVARIHKEFNVKISLTEFFENPFIRHLAQLINSKKTDVYSAIEPSEKKEYYPLSPGQKRLYILQMINPENVNYNMLINLQITGNIEKEQIEKIFNKLVERHESLRTRFVTLNDQPIQRVSDKIQFSIDYYDLTSNKDSIESSPQKTTEQIIQKFIQPFTLSNPPLLRVGLIKKDHNTQILMVDMHHIISDGTSHGILMDEFISLSNNGNLPTLKLQYKDFSQWLNHRLNPIEIQKQAQFWLTKFNGALPVMKLPIDFPRPKNRTYHGGFAFFKIEEELATKLREINTKENTTMYIVILTVFSILLAKLTLQEDIIIGSLIAGRKHPDLEKIMGMFVNTIALRNFPENNLSFIQFLKQVKKNTLDSFDNEDFQFDDLIEKLKVEREPGRNPLFDILFMFSKSDMNLNKAEQKKTSLEIKPYSGGVNQVKFDLLFTGIDTGDNLSFTIQYSTELFKNETIERYIKYFREIVTLITKKETILIKDINISYELVTAVSDIYDHSETDFDL